MNTPAEDKSAAVHCAEFVRTHDFARYASALFVPAQARRALLALYAFNAEICRVHTQVSQPLPGEIRLQWWRDMLAGDGHGGVEGNPVAAELLQAVRSYRLPVERLSRLNLDPAVKSALLFSCPPKRIGRRSPFASFWQR